MYRCFCLQVAQALPYCYGCSFDISMAVFVTLWSPSCLYMIVQLYFTYMYMYKIGRTDSAVMLHVHHTATCNVQYM